LKRGGRRGQGEGHGTAGRGHKEGLGGWWSDFILPSTSAGCIFFITFMYLSV
jgi:hypothetical protein